MAIQAAMLGTNPAGLFQSLPQLLPGPVTAHIQIVFADAKARGDGDWVFRVQIETADQVTVLRRQGGD